MSRMVASTACAICRVSVPCSHDTAERPSAERSGCTRDRRTSRARWATLKPPAVEEGNVAADDLRSLAEKMIAGSRAHEDPRLPTLPPGASRRPAQRPQRARGARRRPPRLLPVQPLPPPQARLLGPRQLARLHAVDGPRTSALPRRLVRPREVYSGNALVEDDVTYLFYTGNVRFPDGGRDTHQCLATTTDFTTFTKAPGNPLIPEPPDGYTRHVRDPNVWRDADGSLRMLVGAQRADLTGAALLYRSEDRLAWTFEESCSSPATRRPSPGAATCGSARRWCGCRTSSPECSTTCSSSAPRATTRTTRASRTCSLPAPSSVVSTATPSTPTGHWPRSIAGSSSTPRRCSRRPRPARTHRAGRLVRQRGRRRPALDGVRLGAHVHPGPGAAGAGRTPRPAAGPRPGGGASAGPGVAADAQQPGSVPRRPRGLARLRAAARLRPFGRRRLGPAHRLGRLARRRARLRGPARRGPVHDPLPARRPAHRDAAGQGGASSKCSSTTRRSSCSWGMGRWRSACAASSPTTPAASGWGVKARSVSDPRGRTGSTEISPESRAPVGNGNQLASCLGHFQRAGCALSMFNV